MLCCSVLYIIVVTNTQISVVLQSQAGSRFQDAFLLAENPRLSLEPPSQLQHSTDAWPRPVPPHLFLQRRSIDALLSQTCIETLGLQWMSFPAKNPHQVDAAQTVCPSVLLREYSC